MTRGKGVVTEMTVFGNNSNRYRLETMCKMQACTEKYHAMKAGYRKCLFRYPNLLPEIGVPSERTDLIRRD